MNAGVLGVIWRSAVFLAALADYIFFGVTFKYYHYIGCVACVSCTVLIGISKIDFSSKPEDLTGVK